MNVQHIFESKGVETEVFSELREDLGLAEPFHVDPDHPGPVGKIKTLFYVLGFNLLHLVWRERDARDPDGPTLMAFRRDKRPRSGPRTDAQRTGTPAPEALSALHLALRGGDPSKHLLAHSPQYPLRCQARAELHVRGDLGVLRWVRTRPSPHSAHSGDAT